MRTPLVLITAAVLALGATGCGNDDTASPRTDPSPSDPTTPDPGPNLDGRTFLSVEWRVNGEVEPLVAGTRIRISFVDGELSVSPGCNSGGGAYSIDDDGRLVTEAIGMTDMACDDARMAQDDRVLELLNDLPLVTLDGDSLRIASDVVELDLLDREIADPDRPLVGTRWTLTSLLDGESASSVPEGVEAWLEFDDTDVQGSFGCNTGGGSYTRAGSVVTFGPLRTTQKACEAPGGAVESRMVSVLDGATDITIEAGALTITRGDVGLGFTAAATE